MDLIDRKIVAALQADATLSIQQIADRVGLSQTPCWKRIQKLEHSGVIRGRVALVDPAAIGLGLTVFVSVSTGDHSPEWRERFAQSVTGMEEVMDLYRMAGEVDYMLRVVVRDMAAYDAFYKRLTEAVAVKSVVSRFAMEAIKSTTAFPIDTVTR
jgi:Lrp/AsnC family transcriptional regulator